MFFKVLLLFNWIWNNLSNIIIVLQISIQQKIILTVSCPGFHPAGQTSPCLSVYWKACTNLKVSSTLLPTGRSFIVICLRVPFGSMINKPLIIAELGLLDTFEASPLFTSMCGQHHPKTLHMLWICCGSSQTIVVFEPCPNHLLFLGC